MNLRDSYESWRKDHVTQIFDTEGDEDFARAYFGPTLGEFIRKIMQELMDMQRRLDELEESEEE